MSIMRSIEKKAILHAVSEIFLITVGVLIVSSHLHVFCCYFNCLMSLFQGHVANCWNFTPLGLHTGYKHHLKSVVFLSCFFTPWKIFKMVYFPMNLRCYFKSGDNEPKERQPLHSKGKNNVKILTWLQGDWTGSIRVSYIRPSITK